MKGGPGCSSLINFALSHGPYVFEDGATNFTANPYAWNKNATVFYIESPAGVGFSVCGDKEECQFTDDISAADHLGAVIKLLKEKFTAL